MGKPLSNHEAYEGYEGLKTYDLNFVTFVPFVVKSYILRLVVAQPHSVSVVSTLSQ